jgi:imidazolonepropionase-like amidohydrolase
VRRLAIRAAGLFDGQKFSAGPVLVLSENGSVIDVDYSGAPPPEHADVLDWGDLTLLPGLVDAHTHLSWDPRGHPEQLLSEDSEYPLARARRHAGQALSAGITTLRDLGSRGFDLLSLREDYRRGRAVGPELLVSGPPITRSNGHAWFLGGVADTLDQVVAAVAERARQGVDWVKVMATGGFTTRGSDPGRPNYDLETITALVRSAHAHGLPVTAHAHATSGIADLVEAGVDGIEHCTFSTSRGAVLDAALVEAMAERGIPAGITLARPQGVPEPWIQEILDRVVPHAGELMRAGVRVALCTDAGINPVRPHDVLPADLVYAAERGLSGRQVLAAATSVAAEVCGVGHRKGRVAPGYDADLIAVSGNPVHDIRAILEVRAVVRAGVLVR